MQLIDSRTVKTRFAPSPTGHLHLGHVYAAKFAKDLANQHNGEFLLRFEDIDKTRVRPVYYNSIKNDLNWLEIKYTGTPIKQLDRLQEYQNALETLKSLNAVYPCFCSRQDIQRELEHITQAPHGKERLYPQTCRSLTKNEISKKLQQGLIPAWRMHTDISKEITGELTFTDTNHGEITVIHDLLGDTILARKDIGTSYHIAVAVDDAFQQITHVTRGEDLLEATHVHRVLQSLLHLPCPVYQHHKLIKNEAGERLAKRAFSQTIQELRASGVQKTDILQMLNSEGDSK